MISVLIPVYNFVVVDLVGALQKEAGRLWDDYEILVVDDGSSGWMRQQNRLICQWPNVKLRELPENIGRARIRNLMAGMARFETLLFMDCDAGVPDDQFIARYVPYAGKDLVVCGGRAYESSPPDDNDLLLRWTYGIRREQTPAVNRSRVPYRSFMTNNFLIQKELMLKIPFDEDLILYGHEDTLFGIELQKKLVPVVHIQNPLVHIGLEVSAEFLRKTAEGIENLRMLVANGKIRREHFIDIRLLQAGMMIKRLKLHKAVLFVYSWFGAAIIRNLRGNNPSLLLFDFHKLAIFFSLDARKSIDNSLHFRV